MAKTPINAEKVKCDRRTNGPTDGPMDGLTKRGVESRSTQLKTKLDPLGSLGFVIVTSVNFVTMDCTIFNSIKMTEKKALLKWIPVRGI